MIVLDLISTGEEVMFDMSLVIKNFCFTGFAADLFP